MRRYRALRFVAALHQVVGVIVAVIGVMAVIFSLFSLRAVGSEGVAMFGVAIAAFLSGMFIYAFGELIYLLIDIEANTRLSSAQS
jgi:hypothetical protein